MKASKRIIEIDTIAKALLVAGEISGGDRIINIKMHEDLGFVVISTVNPKLNEEISPDDARRLIGIIEQTDMVPMSMSDEERKRMA